MRIVNFRSWREMAVAPKGPKDVVTGAAQRNPWNQIALSTPCRIVFALLLLLAAGCESAAQSEPATQRLTIAGRTFNLEMALDSSARYQGLSDREHIDPDGGMLFVFPKAQHLEFVMRRCLVPIDLIYLDGSGRVVSTHQMTVEPYDTPERKLKRYRSDWPAQFAIELRAGSIEALGVKPGQKVDLPADDLKKRAR